MFNWLLNTSMLGLIQFVQKLGFNMGIIMLQVLSHLPSMLIKVKTLSTQQALSCSMSTEGFYNISGFGQTNINGQH